MDDVIIVGSGLGGLVSGALLAKRGRSVCVMEQHDVPGGCATTFRRRHYTFEVGLHALDGLDEDDLKLRVFDELQVLEHVPFIHLPPAEFFRFEHPDLSLMVPGRIELARQVLAEVFPHEARNLRRFFRTMTVIRRTLNELFAQARWKVLAQVPLLPLLYPTLFRHWNVTIGDYLDATFDDEMLKLVLVSNLLYYHDDPRKLSLYWYCLSQGSFLSGGTHYVRGGSQVLSDYFAHVIRSHGGQVLVRHDVEEILVKDGRATGVRYRQKGRGRAAEVRHARTVIANAAPPVVAQDLVKGPEGEALRRHFDRYERSCSFLSLYLGLRRRPRDLGNRAFSTVMPGVGVNRIDDMVREYRSEGFAQKGFEFVDYSQIDHGLTTDERCIGVASMVDYVDNWRGLSRADYCARKDQFAQHVIQSLDRRLPGLAESVELYEVGTPMTIERYTRNPGGAIYGYRQDPRQTAFFRPGHTCGVADLYFASAWVNPGGGFTGAMLSGWSCARVVHERLGASRVWRSFAAGTGRRARSASPDPEAVSDVVL